MSSGAGGVVEGTRVAVMLRQQQAEDAKLDGAIAANLTELGYAK